jgi:hypothetical protein
MALDAEFTLSVEVKHEIGGCPVNIVACLACHGLAVPWVDNTLTERMCYFMLSFMTSCTRLDDVIPIPEKERFLRMERCMASEAFPVLDRHTPEGS